MEPSGIRLGSLRGTTIHVEISFLILIALFVILNLESGAPMERALLWAPILFFSVLLHEIGHAATIGALGFGPSQISLAGLGGLTTNARRSQPWQDILISVAGPLTSFLIAVLSLVLIRVVPYFRTDPMFSVLLPTLVWANTVWGIFNLLPIHPLDGGQALRNLARMVTRERTALMISVWISMIVGGALAVWGLLRGQFFIAILAAVLTVQNFRQWQIVRTIDPNPPAERD